MQKYSVAIQWSQEDSGYIATIPELSGLSAFGASREEAMQELEIATEAYLEVLKENGYGLPHPDTLNSYSGQTRTRLPKGLHASLSREAKREGISLNTYIVHLLSERHINYQVDKKIERLDDNVKILGNQLSTTNLYEHHSEKNIAGSSPPQFFSLEVTESEEKESIH